LPSPRGAGRGTASRSEAGWGVRLSPMRAKHPAPRPGAMQPTGQRP